MNKVTKNIIIFLVAVGVIGLLFSFGDTSLLEHPKEAALNKLVEQINNEQVKDIQIASSSDSMLVTLNDNSKETVRKEAGETFNDIVKTYQIDLAKVSKVNLTFKDETFAMVIGSILPFILLFVVGGAFVFMMVRQVQGANRSAMTFGLSRARMFDGKNDKARVTFKDVAGAKEAKEELVEVVEFLKEPKKFTDLGAKIPRGVLLMGAPGTGKTLLAKAVAGEAGVPFFLVSGSEFNEMFVGVGASRVRDLFAQAKKAAPAIVFIDEIDAVGRQRGAGMGGPSDEREQTLNQILVELDGFEPHANVIVMAATNRPDVLDPALLRPGRFDRRVVLDMPTIDDREAILKVHAEKKPLAKDVDLRRIAQRTVGFSGADLANLLNEAAILAARNGKKHVVMTDILMSIDKVILGPERKSQVVSDKEKKITAYHEGGHALVSHQLEDAPPVQKISIISRGQAAGYTLNTPMEDKRFHTRKEFIAELAVLLGGFVAEKEIFGDVSTGASNDLEKATRVAKRLVTQFGMSEVLGPRTFGEREEMVFLGRDLGHQRDYSEKTADAIDQEISSLIHDAQITAKKVVTQYRTKLEEIVQLLLEKETLEKEEFDAIFA